MPPISTGKELKMTTSAIKDFTFHIISPILKGLKKDSNSHALKDFTRCVLSWTGIARDHKGGQVRSLIQDGDFLKTIMRKFTARVP